MKRTASYFNWARRRKDVLEKVRISAIRDIIHGRAGVHHRDRALPLGPRSRKRLPPARAVDQAPSIRAAVPRGNGNVPAACNLSRPLLFEDASGWKVRAIRYDEPALPWQSRRGPSGTVHCEVSDRDNRVRNEGPIFSLRKAAVSFAHRRPRSARDVERIGWPRPF